MATLTSRMSFVPSLAATTTDFAGSNSTPSSTLTMKRSFQARSAQMRTPTTVAAYQGCNVRVTLITPEGDRVVHVSKDESILDAAERQGVSLPHNCRSGACSACAGVLKSGTLKQDDQYFLTEEQLRAGFALMCASYPTSDCVIETHQEEKFY